MKNVLRTRTRSQTSNFLASTLQIGRFFVLVVRILGTVTYPLGPSRSSLPIRCRPRSARAALVKAQLRKCGQIQKKNGPATYTFNSVDRFKKGDSEPCVRQGDTHGGSLLRLNQFKLESEHSNPDGHPGENNPMDAEFAAEPAKAQAELELVARIRAGDRLAEDELVASYRRGLLLIATARTRDREAARDLTQEILMAVLMALRKGKLRDAEKLSAFVQGTARNLINNYLREKARRLECDLDAADGPAKDPVKELELADEQRLIRRELEGFSPVDRQILLLSLVDGHSLLEVAQRLGLSHDAVRARRSRMIRKITKKFAQMSQK